MRILGISGSLRRGSHNRRLLRAAGDAAPARGRAGGVGGPRRPARLRRGPRGPRRPSRCSEFLDAIEERRRAPDRDARSTTPRSRARSRTRSTGPRARSPTTSCATSRAPSIGASTGLFGAVWAQAEVRKVLKASGAHVLESELPVGMADCAFDDRRRARRPRARRAAGRPPRRSRARGGGAGRAIGMIGSADGRRSRSQFDDGQTPRERADAARNRARILEAAARARRASTASTASRWTTSRARRASAPARCTAASATAPGSRSRCSTSTRASSRTR